MPLSMREQEALRTLARTWQTMVNSNQATPEARQSFEKQIQDTLAELNLDQSVDWINENIPLDDMQFNFLVWLAEQGMDDTLGAIAARNKQIQENDQKISTHVIAQAWNATSPEHQATQQIIKKQFGYQPPKRKTDKEFAEEYQKQKEGYQFEEESLGAELANELIPMRVSPHGNKVKQATYAWKFQSGEKGVSNPENKEMNINFLGTGSLPYFAGMSFGMRDAGDNMCQQSMDKAVYSGQPSIIVRGLGTPDTDADFPLAQLNDPNINITGHVAGGVAQGSGLGTRLQMAMEGFYIPNIIQMVLAQKKANPNQPAEVTATIQGHSRGAITTYYMANIIDEWLNRIKSPNPDFKLDELAKIYNIDPNDLEMAIQAIQEPGFNYKSRLLLFDPVEGGTRVGETQWFSGDTKIDVPLQGFAGKFTPNCADMPETVSEAEVRLAESERRQDFRPTVATFHPNTKVQVNVVMGSHSALTGNLGNLSGTRYKAYTNYPYVRQAMNGFIDKSVLDAKNFMFGDELSPLTDDIVRRINNSGVHEHLDSELQEAYMVLNQLKSSEKNSETKQILESMEFKCKALIERMRKEPDASPDEILKEFLDLFNEENLKNASPTIMKKISAKRSDKKMRIPEHKKHPCNLILRAVMVKQCEAMIEKLKALYESSTNTQNKQILGSMLVNFQELDTDLQGTRMELAQAHERFLKATEDLDKLSSESTSYFGFGKVARNVTKTYTTAQKEIVALREAYTQTYGIPPDAMGTPVDAPYPRAKAYMEAKYQEARAQNLDMPENKMDAYKWLMAHDANFNLCLHALLKDDIVRLLDPKDPEYQTQLNEWQTEVKMDSGGLRKGNAEIPREIYVRHENGYEFKEFYEFFPKFNPKKVSPFYPEPTRIGGQGVNSVIDPSHTKINVENIEGNLAEVERTIKDAHAYEQLSKALMSFVHNKSEVNFHRSDNLVEAVRAFRAQASEEFKNEGVSHFVLQAVYQFQVTNFSGMKDFFDKLENENILAKPDRESIREAVIAYPIAMFKDSHQPARIQTERDAEQLIQELSKLCIAAQKETMHLTAEMQRSLDQQIDNVIDDYMQRLNPNLDLQATLGELKSVWKDDPHKLMELSRGFTDQEVIATMEKYKKQVQGGMGRWVGASGNPNAEYAIGEIMKVWTQSLGAKTEINGIIRAAYNQCKDKEKFRAAMTEESSSYKAKSKGLLPTQVVGEAKEKQKSGFYQMYETLQDIREKAGFAREQFSNIELRDPPPPLPGFTAQLKQWGDEAAAQDLEQVPEKPNQDQGHGPRNRF